MKKRTIFLFISLILLTSCNLFKHVARNKTSEELKSSSQVADQTNSKTDTKTNIHDLVTEKITESTQDTLHFPAKQLQGSQSGQSITIESGDQQITATYDHRTNIIKAMGTIKAKDVPVNTTKVTERTIDHQQDQAKSEDLLASHKESKTDDIKKENSTVEKTTFKLPGWIWLLVLIPIGMLLWYLFKKFKNLLV